MSTITWPSTRAFFPSSFQWGLDDNILTTTSPLNKQAQTLELPGSRWVAEVTLPAGTPASRAELEAFFFSLRSGANRLALWHLLRPAPRGTMRSTPTLSATATAGASSLSILTSANATALAGDLVKIGSQVVMNAADATANGSGAMTMTLVSPVRATVSSGSSVTWDKPTALFIPTAPVRFRYDPLVGQAISVSLVEVFE